MARFRVAAPCPCEAAPTRSRCATSGAASRSAAAETIDALDARQVVAAHVQARKGDEVLALDHYREVLAIKPRALAGDTALARARAFTAAHDQFWAQARRRL